MRSKVLHRLEGRFPGLGDRIPHDLPAFGASKLVAVPTPPNPPNTPPNKYFNQSALGQDDTVYFAAPEFYDDKTGKLVLGGREDDVVKVDGKRIALGEVEGCIEAFGKVKAAQALVITDPLGGPMVVAKVVVSSKCGAEEIIDHCARNLASYKVPRRIEFCEALPA